MYCNILRQIKDKLLNTTLLTIKKRYTTLWISLALDFSIKYTKFRYIIFTYYWITWKLSTLRGAIQVEMVFLLDQAVGEMVLPLTYYVWALDFGAKLWPPATVIFLLRNIFCLAPGVCRNWMPDHGTAGDHMTWATVVSDLPRYRTRDDQASLLHEEDMTYMAEIPQPLKAQVSCLSKLFPLLQLIFCS